jgi:hypothetical protein
MPISNTEKQKSIKFMSALQKVLNMIDELSNLIPEGKYLELMDTLKAINDNKPSTIKDIVKGLTSNEVVVNAQLRILMPLLGSGVTKNTKKQICEYCDTQVLYLSLHQKTKKCMDISKTKKLSADSKKYNTSNIKLMIKGMSRLNNKSYYQQLLKTWKLKTLIAKKVEEDSEKCLCDNCGEYYLDEDMIGDEDGKYNYCVHCDGVQGIQILSADKCPKCGEIEHIGAGHNWCEKCLQEFYKDVLCLS